MTATAIAGPEGFEARRIGLTLGAGGVDVDSRNDGRPDFGGGGPSLGVVFSYAYTDRNRVAAEITAAAGEGETETSSVLSLYGVWSHRFTPEIPGFFVRAGSGWIQVREGDLSVGGLTVLGGFGYSFSERFSLHTDFTWGGSSDDHYQRGFFFTGTWWAW